MSYVDQGMMSRGRMWAIVLVALLHALLGYAFVTGLAYKFVKNVQEDLKTFDVNEEPPPPEEEPPPPEPVEVQPPPITAPPPIVRTNPQPQQIVIRDQLPDRPQITLKAEPRPTTRSCPGGVTVPIEQACPDPRPRTVEPTRPRADLRSYISDSDYPPSALRNEEEGTTGFRLTIGPNGRVTDCSITSSSGSSALDNATCSIMRRRARFEPARDQYGNPTTGTHNARIAWRIQG